MKKSVSVVFHWQKLSAATYRQQVFYLGRAVSPSSQLSYNGGTALDASERRVK